MTEPFPVVRTVEKGNRRSTFWKQIAGAAVCSESCVHILVCKART